jgi:hypothetical protein
MNTRVDIFDIVILVIIFIGIITSSSTTLAVLWLSALLLYFILKTLIDIRRDIYRVRGLDVRSKKDDPKS